MKLKFHTLPLSTLWLVPLATSAAKVSFKQIKHRPVPHNKRGENSPSNLQNSVASADDADGLSLNTVHDLIYIANITVAGKDHPVQLDTGSSDLWIKGESSPLPNTEQTSTTYNLTYAIGWAYGHVAYAPIEFAGLSIPKQAFLDVSTAQNPALGFGADGIAGLGFTSLSTIDALANASSSSTGRSLLYNMFAANPSEPNFLAFSLQRSTEEDDEVEGSFSIGEYEPQYAMVANQSSISTWPVNSPKRWNVLLDAVIVGDRIVTPTTTVVGAPSNKAVVLLHSGSSYTYAPKAICDAIYGNVTDAKFDASAGQWTVPCSYEVNMALQIGGQIFPIHPLDVTPVSLTDPSTCVGSFVPQSVAVGAGEFDWLIGDNFLRSVYAVYDFGDFDSSGQMGNPYMKLLSIIDPDEGSVDFHNVRGGEPQTNITYHGLGDVSIQPSFNISQDISASLERIGRYIPAMLGVVALNALVLLVLAAAGTVIYCRRRSRRSAPARTPRGRFSPMPMNPRNSYVPGVLPLSEQPHSYQPVSMALTEDTFVPPSPAFHKFDGQLSDRPKSIA
jgi:saccharopepsin